MKYSTFPGPPTQEQQVEYLHMPGLSCNCLQLSFIRLSLKSCFVLQKCQYYSYLHFPFFFGKSVDPS